MNYRVTILQTPFQFDVRAGETVLQAALRQDIPVPGAMHYPDGEPLALFEEDAAAGMGLFCVGYPTTDLVLAVPEMGTDWEPWEAQ